MIVLADVRSFLSHNSLFRVCCVLYKVLDNRREFELYFPLSTFMATMGVNPCSNMGEIILGRNIHPAFGMYCAARLSRAVWGHGPPDNFFLNGAIWCVLLYIWIRFCFYKISKISIFYIKYIIYNIYINFFIKIKKMTIFK